MLINNSLRSAMLVSVIAVVQLILTPSVAHAYTTNMDASLVLGQANFTTTDRTGVNPESWIASPSRGSFVDPAGRLIVTDTNAHRILIWNTVPTQNGAPADLVLGQAGFSSFSANRGGSVASNTLNSPYNAFSDGTRLLVADRSNNRVLIWSSFPTINGQAADLVLGISVFTTAPPTSCTASTFGSPWGVFIHNGKLLVSDGSNNRVLIWSNVPTVSNAPADVVVGQPDATTCTAQAVTDKSMSDARWVMVDAQGKMIVGDRARKRVLIWNTVPVSNYSPANVVVGQADFTSSDVGVSTNRFGALAGVYSSGSKLFVADGNARVLIFNSVPTSNNASADIVLGQNSFTSASANGGGAVSAKGFSNALVLFTYEHNRQLFVTDEGNSRILIFKNPVPAVGSFSGLLDAAKKPHFTWSFADGDPGDTQHALRLQFDTAPTFNSANLTTTSQIAQSDTSYTYPQVLGAGTWFVRLQLQDSQGDWGDYSTPISLTGSAPGTTPASEPTSTLTPSSPGMLNTPVLTAVGTIKAVFGAKAYYYTGHRPTFTGTATPGATITILIHSDPITLTTVADAQGNWSATPTQDLPDGDHSVTITASGEAGQVSPSISFVLGINTGLAATGNPAPLVSVVGLIGLAATRTWLKRRYAAATDFS